MKNISFRDLRLCTPFVGMSEIQMLTLENDDNMAWALDQIGFDIEYPISYVPLKHRDMQGKVGLGFMCVGEINMNSSYVESSLCTLAERMIVAAYTDPSLTKELSNLMGMRVNFRSLLENGTDSSREDLPDEMLEPDRELVGFQIEELERLRDHIRGSMLNDRGEAKTFAEYKLH
jgi:hypothetical protein